MSNLFVIKLGNLAAHTELSVQQSDALASLRELVEVVYWIDYCYGEDYVERTFDESLLPTEKRAVLEAKRNSKEPNIGRKQVFLYADCLKRKFERRPMMFTANGFETCFWDDQSSSQWKVSGVFSKDDLQKLMNQREERLDLMER